MGDLKTSPECPISPVTPEGARSRDGNDFLGFWDLVGEKKIWKHIFSIFQQFSAFFSSFEWQYFAFLKRMQCKIAEKCWKWWKMLKIFFQIFFSTQNKLIYRFTFQLFPPIPASSGAGWQGFHNFQWKSMKINENQWKPMEINEKSMKINENPKSLPPRPRWCPNRRK